MRGVLKNLLGLIAGVGIAVLSLMGLFVVLILGVFIFGSFHQWRSMAACYDQDTSAENVQVDFVGRTLNLPKSQIHHCAPEEYASDLAEINMVGILPDFSKPDYEIDYFLKHKDEIRLYFRGTNLGRYPEASSLDIGSDIERGFRYRMTIMINQDGKKVPKYEKARDTDFGLIWYKTRLVNQGAQDMYIHRDKQGKIDLILDCFKEHPASTQRYFTCSTSDRDIYSNVNYSYSYDRVHLPKAVEIDSMMKSFIQKAQNAK